MRKDLIIHEVEQGTNAWKEVKSGKFGGTTADTFLVNGKSADGIGVGLRNLIYRKAKEWMLGPNLDQVTSAAMERGTALEPVARERYELDYFVNVEQVGYIQWRNYFGVSPDGLIGDSGSIEIKCPDPETFIKWLDCDRQVSNIPKGYYAQMQWLMFITGREWCDYMVFCPEFEPSDYTVTRVHRCEADMVTFTNKCLVVEGEMNRVLKLVAENTAA